MCFFPIPEPEFVIVKHNESIPRNRVRQAGNRFLGSLKGLQIRAQVCWDLFSCLQLAKIKQTNLGLSPSLTDVKSSSSSIFGSPEHWWQDMISFFRPQRNCAKHCMRKSFNDNIACGSYRCWVYAGGGECVLPTGRYFIYIYHTCPQPFLLRANLCIFFNSPQWQKMRRKWFEKIKNRP